MRNWLRVPLVLKYLLGVALVQGMTVLLMFAWWHTGSADVGLTLAALGVATGFFAALWLASMAHGDHREDLIRAQGELARQRERHLRLTEKERSKAAANARRDVQRETRKVRNRSSIKLGGAVVGIAGLGTLLLLTQFLSLGVLLVSSSGGALAGYLLRARQELRRQNRADLSAFPRPVEGMRILNRDPNQSGDPESPANRDRGT